jgi:hypothetical protein
MIYWQNGIRVANAVANVAMKGNRVISYGANFAKPSESVLTYPQIY